MDTESILVSVKRMLGILPNDRAFDDELIMHINGVFMTLQQLGVGPKTGFSISDYDATWSDFTDNSNLIGSTRMFVYLKVRIIFDPPTSSAAADAINNRISELEFRLNSQAECDAESNGEDSGSSSTPTTNTTQSSLSVEDGVLFYGKGDARS